MKCNEFEIQLNAVLDDRLQVERDAALVGHARQCAACAELLAATGQWLDGVGSLRVPELDGGALSRRVMDELKRETVSTTPRFGLLAAALVATAVAVLVAAFLLPGFLENNVAVKQATEPTPSNVEVAMAKPVDLDRDMVLKLIQDTRRNIDEIPSLLTGGSAQPTSTEQTSPNRGDDGLDEIAKSMVGSFGFLLDVLEETDRQPNS